MYKPVEPKVDFPKMEEKILEFWQNHNIFEKSISNREGCDEYIFYDGPPFATGLPHFGHFVPGTIKDIFPRYMTMKGKKVDRRFGWDCHGLPVEYEMEKELGISGRREIEEYGVALFNESCRSIVLRYTKEWENIITRLGRWVDFEHDYKTMEPDYMESIWWVVKQLWEKDLIYEGHYILPYCPRCSTALSNFELNLGGYKEVQDPAVTVKFKVSERENTYILAWTTTPWTLPSNLGLVVGPEIDYVEVEDGEERYIFAKERLGAYYREEDEYRVVSEMKGTDLEGLSYEPLFPYFSEVKEQGAFKVITADYVTVEDGTGIVHAAPGFGEEDYEAFRGTDVPVITPVDGECRFTDEVSDFKGEFVKDADKGILRYLKDKQKIVRHDTYQHPYPHCWRCKSPLIYRAISSWFVKIDPIKDKMIKANQQIYWMPEHLKEGRFGNWLENARDWAISRNRYWGNPLPIWRCNDCGRSVCIGSREELENISGEKPEDLHKHFVDKITWKCKCGGSFTRIPEVLDCWFESGSMPYAQNHYPFENKKWFEANFPADFISEGLDQTRGWFYTLTVLAAALFDSPAFKNVIVNGLVLSEDGKKMSKSERNYSDPVDIMNQFGADALRLFLMNSAVVKAEDLRYSDEGVRDILKSIIIPLWNAYSFFVTYANIDQIFPSEAPKDPDNPLDRWVLSAAESLTEEVTAQLDLYDLTKAVDPVVKFIDQLNNWYIRRSRRRFWRSENDADKEQAYQTLYGVLLKVVMVAAPVIPFITEEIYQNLKGEGMNESVHHCDYPVPNKALINKELERKMDITQTAVRLGRAIRSIHNLKIRQPLKAIHLVTRNLEERRILREMEDIIREELNVKDVIFRENEEDLVEYSAKPNYRILGKELGKHMKAAAKKIEALSMQEIQSLIEGNVLNIDLGPVEFDITKENVEIRRSEKENLKVLNEGSLTVALDPEITEELKKEGMVRDVIRGVQNLRKDIGLDVTDRIELFLDGDEYVKEAVESFQDYLMNETLAVSLSWQKNDDARKIECGDKACYASVRKSTED